MPDFLPLLGMPPFTAPILQTLGKYSVFSDGGCRRNPRATRSGFCKLFKTRISGEENECFVVLSYLQCYIVDALVDYTKFYHVLLIFETKA